LLDHAGDCLRCGLVDFVEYLRALVDRYGRDYLRFRIAFRGK